MTMISAKKSSLLLLCGAVVFVIVYHQRIAQFNWTGLLTQNSTPAVIEYPDAALLSPSEQLASFNVHPDYKVTLYASEEKFPLHAPTSMAFDAKGRLWLSTAPDYASAPGKASAPDGGASGSLLILRDNDGDGNADHHTVFASGLTQPMSFALVENTVYLARPPQLLRLRDLNLDGAVDETTAVLNGFFSNRSRSAISDMGWGPDGGLYIYQGKGGVSHLETPRGPRSLDDSGIWRFEPSTLNVELMASHPFTEPTRQAFDATGNSILCDKPSGDVHYAGYVSVPHQYPYAENEATEAQPYKPLIRAGGTTPACVLATNNDFSAAEHSNGSANGVGLRGGYGKPRLIIAQHGAFNGLRWYTLSDKMAGFSAEELETPLLRTTDTNFRPIALEFGPDGALYVLDFYSPISSTPYSQTANFSAQDPRRDRRHGRVWRIAKKETVVSEAIDYSQANVSELFTHLLSPSSTRRAFARRQLQQGEASEVLGQLQHWVTENTSPQAQLEALWVASGQSILNDGLLNSLLSSKDFNVRAAAARLLRLRLRDVSQPFIKLHTLVDDEHPRVRLEGVLAAAHLPSSDAAGLALLSANKESNLGMGFALDRTLKALAPYGKPSLLTSNEEQRKQIRLTALSDAELLLKTPGDRVLAEILGRESIEVTRRLSYLSQQSVALRWFAELPADNALVPILLARLVNSDESGLKYLYRKVKSWRAHARNEFRWLEAALRFRLGESIDDLSDSDLVNVLSLINAVELPQKFIRKLSDLTTNGRLRNIADSQKLLTLLDRGVPESKRAPNEKIALKKLAQRVASYTRGTELYAAHCSQCHLKDGQGLAGAYPSLAANERVQADAKTLIRILLHGVKGPIVANYQSYNSVMAPVGNRVDDQAIVDILNFIRLSWGNNGSTVVKATVAEMRAQYSDRRAPWTMVELIELEQLNIAN
ncbi:MAG: PVC-type heme-binding CxxCH protein [Pseudomonadales bacterium]